MKSILNRLSVFQRASNMKNRYLKNRKRKQINRNIQKINEIVIVHTDKEITIKED